MSSVLSRIAPPAGARTSERRVGRGIGSNLGKTCGRGSKGQKARNGGNIGKLQFEGGQTPLARRLPKRGFTSPTRDRTAEVRTSELERMKASEIDLATLKTERIVPQRAQAAKVILSGKLTRKLALKGVLASKGARAAIEAAGGSVALPAPKPEAAAD